VFEGPHMPGSAMLPHTFSHDGATYVVSFKPIGDQWRAALYKRDDGSITELGPIAAEDLRACLRSTGLVTANVG
jgi:hypothetical protein